MKKCKLLFLIVLGVQGAIVNAEPLAMVAKSDALISVGLAPEARSAVAQQMNILLANEYALYIMTQKFHWNVVGPFFGQLHKLFNDQYEMLAEIVDAVAERVRALGFKTYGSLDEFKQHAIIQEEPGMYPKDTGMIAALLQGHETIIKSIRPIVSLTAQADDMGTNNFLAGLLEKHEKAAWFLRAHMLHE